MKQKMSDTHDTSYIKIKRTLTISALIFILSSQSTLAQSFRDKDWNVNLWANCGMPKRVNGTKPARMVKIEGDRKLMFSLEKGQVGPCSTDNMERHSAPYWERAEVRQRNHLKLGKAYSISFEATFMEGFKGRQEAFFQIHGWNGDCHAYPPVMMHFSGGTLNIWALRGVDQDAGKEWMSSSQGSHRSVQKRIVKINQLIGRTTLFEIQFDTRKGGNLSVYVNGEPVVENTPVEYASCAKPHMKMGIYRPGGSNNKKSVVVFDDVNVRVIE